MGRSGSFLFVHVHVTSSMPVEVLIVDDSEFMRNLLREILEGEHTIVAEAENGVEAVNLHDEHEPDVVMMDIAMPIQDGVETTDEIKSKADTCVIMCTSVEQEEMMKEAIKAGADGYITKPFQKENVLQEIEETVPA